MLLAQLPEAPSWIEKLTPVLTICILAILSAWYGIPAVAKWAKELVESFKTEIRAEREYGLTLVREERTSNERALQNMQDGYEKMMGEHRTALDRNTVATEAMTKKIEEVLRSR